MALNMKIVLGIVLFCVAMYLSSCNPSAKVTETEVASTATPSVTILQTAMGDLAIGSTRLVNQVHGQEAQSGEWFLLVVLTQPDLRSLDASVFLLEDFQKMIQESNGQIYVSTEDGTQYISTMAGWIEEAFTMGFTVPDAESYSLHWLDNPPIELNPKGE